MGKSMRALHWAESKHPRDNRGRFAKTGGGKWLERVGEQAKAAFGDVSLGYRPGHEPAGRLQTGKGGLIDIGGLHKAAKAAKAANAPTGGGGGGKINPQSLKVGDRFKNAHGVEHEVLSEPTGGRRAGAAVTRVKVRRVADGKEGPVTLDGPVELTGGKAEGVKGPQVGRTATGKLDTSRVSGETGGMSTTQGGPSAGDALKAEMRDGGGDTAKLFGAPTGRDTIARRGRTAAGKTAIPTTSGGKVDAKPARAENRVARTASGAKETPKPTGVDAVMKARSAKAKREAFAALTADEIVEAFQRDPGKALGAYVQKNFGKGTRYERQAYNFDNVVENLKSGHWTPDQAAEHIRRMGSTSRGMEYHKWITLAADLTDGTVAKRRGAPKVEAIKDFQRAAAEARAKGLPEGSHLMPGGGNVDTPKVEPPKRYQTFADRMAGDMSEADRRAGHIAGDENRARLRAQEAEQARQRAEAAANDTRTEREKLTQLLQEQHAVRDLGMRSGRLDPKRETRIKAAEARLAALDTEDRKAKLKDLGAAKGDKVKTPLGEFEVSGVTKDGYLRVVRPDGRKGTVDPKNIESVTKAPKANASKYANLTDEQLANSIVMRGTESAEGKALVAEQRRRASLAGANPNADGGNVDRSGALPKA